MIFVVNCHLRPTFFLDGDVQGITEGDFVKASLVARDVMGITDPSIGVTVMHAEHLVSTQHCTCPAEAVIDRIPGSWGEVQHEETLPDGRVIRLYCAQEFDQPDYDWDCFEPGYRKKLLGQIDRGTMLWFCAQVTCSVYCDHHRKETITGTNSLGGCCYESIKAFVEPDGDGYWDDMKAEASK